MDQRQANPEQWPPYEVVCATFDAIGSDEGHRHLRSLDTRDPDGATTRWNIPDVMAALRAKERFVVAGTEALLQVGLCPACPFMTLRFGPSDVAVPTCD
jgi:hypothetical protein